jgi:hypothetical protein
MTNIGGYLRAEADYHAGGTLTPGVGPVIGGNRDYVSDRESQQFAQRTRFLWSFDTRTATEYGALRSYARTGIQWTTGDSVNVGSNASAYIDRAFLQFAGFTAGRAVSYFDIYSFSLHSFNTNIIGSDSGGTGINLFAYTRELGNGFSASISAEERTSRDKPNVDTIGTPRFFEHHHGERPRHRHALVPGRTDAAELRRQPPAGPGLGGGAGVGRGAQGHAGLLFDGHYGGSRRHAAHHRMWDRARAAWSSTTAARSVSGSKPTAYSARWAVRSNSPPA